MIVVKTPQAVCSRQVSQGLMMGLTAFEVVARTPTSASNLKIIEMPRSLSADKLVHSEFKQLDHRKSVSRSLRSMQIEEACTNKIQDFSILNQSLQSLAMCSSCKSAKSRIIIMQNNQKKMGLAEFLVVLKRSSLQVENCLEKVVHLKSTGKRYWHALVAVSFKDFVQK